MTFRHIVEKYPKDADYDNRTHRLLVRKALLDGTFYDCLSWDFDQETINNGHEYVPLKNRRPNVQNGTGLGRMVVEQTTSMLFGDDRFPNVSMGEEKADALLSDFIEESQLVQKMRDAAFRGSVGSIAIHMRVLPNRQNQRRVHFDVYDTFYLEPEWDLSEPDRLIQITERKKTTGRELKRLGYPIPKDDLDKTFWFVRRWDEESETWFQPSATYDDADLVSDDKRSVIHKLGFCPWVWIKNSHGGDDLDGRCTFEPGILTGIEIDYLSSQVGRGLKYSMDPLLVLKEPPTPQALDKTGAAIPHDVAMGWTNAQGQPVDAMPRGPDKALVMDVTGDAKMLELSGSASEAVMAQVERLRQYAMEAMSGSLVNPDQINSHQGAKALEILHAPLIRQTDNLRSMYGERGLLPLLKMVIETAQQSSIWIKGEMINFAGADASKLALHWKAWFPLTENELSTKINTLIAAKNANLMPTEKAVAILAPDYDIKDQSAMLAAIKAEKEAAVAEQQAAFEAQAKAEGNEEKSPNPDTASRTS